MAGPDPQQPRYRSETLAVRAGQQRSQFGEHSEALYLTSSFVFKDAAQAARRFSGEEEGNVYARFSNPTVTMFEERLAARLQEVAAQLRAGDATEVADVIPFAVTRRRATRRVRRPLPCTAHNNDDFPEPFRPMSAVIVPAWKSTSTSRTATTVP